MKRILLIALIGIANYSFGQWCIQNTGCQNATYSLSTSSFSASTSWQTIGSFRGGEYAKCNVTSGNTYQWSTCNSFGGTHGTNFDPAITLYNSSWSWYPLCFHDDYSSSSSCPTAAYVEWTATYTGYVYILVSNQWYGSCGNHTSSTARVVWRISGSCSTPNTPSISSASSITSSSFTANWGSVSGATSYLIDVSTNSSFTSLALNNYNAGNTTSINLTGASSCTNYWYRVRATNSCGTSGNSSPASLTTSSASLSAPSISSATNVTSSSFTANWTSVSGATSYLIDVSTNSSFTALVLNGANAGNATSADITGCNSGTTYYYRVRATDGCTTSGNSSYTSVTTSSSCTTPSAPSIGSATNVTSSGFTANWSSVSGATSYVIDISTNSSFTALVLSDANAGNNTSANISGTAANTTYWYRVRAKNSCGTSGNSSSTSVTTGSSCSTPTTPSIQSPTGIATSGFTAKWNASSGATTYYIYLSTNSSFSSHVSGYNGANIGNKTSFGLSGLNCNTTYYYRVQAYNSCGYSGYSSYSSVKTSSCTTSNSASNASSRNYNQQVVAEPIQVGTKTYIYKHTDLNMPVVMGNLPFARYYNSLNQSKNSAVGYGWGHSYSYSVQNLNDTAWDVYYPDGHNSRFIPLPNSNGLSFPLYPGTFDSLVNLTSGDYWMFTKEMTIYKFNDNGILFGIVDANGNQTTLNYSGNNLTSVTGPGGRSLTFGYNSNNQIISATTTLGRFCKYGYDGNGDQVYSISPNSDTTKISYTNHYIITVTDPLKNIILTNTYYQGEIINQADAYNINTVFAYNTPSNGDATVTLPGNSKTIYHHDSSYRLVKSTDPYGKTNTIGYDGNNNQIAITNELKQTATFQYDHKGNPTVQTLSGNKVVKSTFNKFSKPTQIIDPIGAKTDITYDNYGNLLTIKLPDNSTRSFTHNSNGTIKLSVDGNSDSTFYFYDSYGDLIKVVTSIGLTTYTYDADGRLKVITDARGNPTTTTYDNVGNIISIKDALNQYLYFTYDKANRLVSFKNKRKCTTYFYYDKKGRMIARKNAIGGIDSMFYDVRDNLIRWKDALGHSTFYSYDSLNRRTSVLNHAGILRYKYDAIGNVILIIDQNNNPVKIGYSETNLIDSLTDALNRVNKMFYDSADNYVKRIDDRGKIKNYGYDPLGKLSKVMDVDNELTLYTYDANGNPKTLKDGNKHVQTFTYGKSNLLKDYTDGANNPYSFTYDSSGNMKTYKKPIGSIAYIYDPLNRVTMKKLSTGETCTYTYDENSNTTSFTNNLGTCYFFYDSLDRRIKTIDVYNNQFIYGYNAVGSLIHIVYSGKDTVKYQYDSVNRMINSIDWKKNATSYEYDATGKVIKEKSPTGITSETKYDAIGRIVSKVTKFKNGKILYGESYTYTNDNFKRTLLGSFPSGLASAKVTNTYQANDAYLGNGEKLCTNDSNGNRVKEILGKDTIIYKWSIDDRVLLMNMNQTKTTYGYDALGNRISRKVGSNEARYANGFYGLLTSPLQITNSSNTVKANYIYGLGLKEQIDSAGNVWYYHFDSRGNTIAITDKNDSILATYTYLLSGTLVSKTGTVGQPFTWLGKYAVAQETNTCYYIRARYYDAYEMDPRFLSKDPLFGDQFEPQSLNRYVYCVNNPIEYFDITGFDKETGLGIKILNGVQLALDIGGLVPGVGELADGTNALIYLARGDKVNATLSGLAMIPIAGWAATGTKLGIKGTKLLKPLGLVSTGRSAAKNLTEKLAMEEIISNPQMGKIIKEQLKDSRLTGWVKMTNETAHGVEIHYVAKWVNGVIESIDDFKFID